MGHAPARLAAGALLALVAASIFASALHAESRESTRRDVEACLGGLDDAGYAFSVLVSIDGDIVLQRGYGQADSTKACPADERTLYQIASITKSFTAIAVFQLAREQRLSLDDTLPVFFPDTPADKSSISVQQLLAHTAGFPQHYVAEGKTTRDEAVRSLLADTITVTPGSAFLYSNENYELLAAIVEVAAGTSWEQYVRARILEPAGMAATRFWDDVAPHAPCPVASVQQEPSSRGARDWGYIGSGGLYTTIVDLHRWFIALIEGKLLPRDDVQRMWTPAREGGSPRIAQGWFVSQTHGETEIWTRGSESWGHNAVLRWFPERRLLVIVATNSGEIGNKQTTGNRLISDRIVETVLGAGEDAGRR